MPQDNRLPLDDNREAFATFLVHQANRPINVEDSPTVEPFGDYRDEITRRVIEGKNVVKPVAGESLRQWMKRTRGRWQR